jgi:hypothetical protein
MDLTASPRHFASAIAGEVMECELGEVAQPHVRENAGKPHPAGSVSELLLGLENGWHNAGPASARISGANGNAEYVAGQHDNNYADIAVWTSMNVTVDRAPGCD